MRLIASITEAAGVCQRLEHIGVDSQTPRISPARRPPLWDDFDALARESVDMDGYGAGLGRIISFPFQSERRTDEDSALARLGGATTYFGPLQWRDVDNLLSHDSILRKWRNGNAALMHRGVFAK